MPDEAPYERLKKDQPVDQVVSQHRQEDAGTNIQLAAISQIESEEHEHEHLTKRTLSDVGRSL